MVRFWQDKFPGPGIGRPRVRVRTWDHGFAELFRDRPARGTTPPADSGRRDRSSTGDRRRRPDDGLMRLSRRGIRRGRGFGRARSSEACGRSGNRTGWRAAAREPGRPRRWLRCGRSGSRAHVPAVEQRLDRVRPVSGHEQLEPHRAKPFGTARSANATSSRPTPIPRCAGSATSIANSPVPSSSRCTRTQPTTRPLSRATAICPARVSSTTSSSVVRVAPSIHSPASATT